MLIIPPLSWALLKAFCCKYSPECPYKPNENVRRCLEAFRTLEEVCDISFIINDSKGLREVMESPIFPEFKGLEVLQN